METYWENWKNSDKFDKLRRNGFRGSELIIINFTGKMIWKVWKVAFGQREHNDTEKKKQDHNNEQDEWCEVYKEFPLNSFNRGKHHTIQNISLSTKWRESKAEKCYNGTFWNINENPKLLTTINQTWKVSCDINI